MQLVSLWFVAALVSAPGAPVPDASHLLEETRVALAGGRNITPERIEIDAIYRYVDDDQEIKDRTVIEPGRRLYQEREIAGKTIRRSWTSEDAFVESPNGRMPLDDAMREDLENYLCLRQLELLILCPGAVAKSVSQPTSTLRVVEVSHKGQSLAEVEIDIETHRLVAIRYAESVGPDLADEALEVRYSAYQTVAGGWTLPHYVQTLVGGKMRSSYSVERWQLDDR